MLGCKGSAWFDGRGKVKRQSHFGQNLPPAERIQPENLASAYHTLIRHPATETSDDGKSKERNDLQTKRNLDASSVSRSFFFLLFQFIGQTANCAPSRKSGGGLSVGGAVAVKQHLLYVRLAIENLPTQLDVGYSSLVAVVLECTTAHLQPRRHLLVGEETLSAQCRAIVRGHTLVVVQQSVEAAHEVENPLVVFGHQFIHVTLDLVGIVIILYLLY